MLNIWIYNFVSDFMVVLFCLSVLFNIKGKNLGTPVLFFWKLFSVASLTALC